MPVPEQVFDSKLERHLSEDTGERRPDIVAGVRLAAGADRCEVSEEQPVERIRVSVEPAPRDAEFSAGEDKGDRGGRRPEARQGGAQGEEVMFKYFDTNSNTKKSHLIFNVFRNVFTYQ